MLFSYNFFTFSQPFSQLPYKFYNRKIQNIHLTQPKIKIKMEWVRRSGFEEWVFRVSGMGVVGCNQIRLSLNKKKWRGWLSWRGLRTTPYGLGITRRRWRGLPTRVGLNRWVYASNKKEGRGTEQSPLRGGDENSNLTGKDELQVACAGALS